MDWLVNILATRSIKFLVTGKTNGSSFSKWEIKQPILNFITHTVLLCFNWNIFTIILICPYWFSCFFSAAKLKIPCPWITRCSDNKADKKLVSLSKSTWDEQPLEDIPKFTRICVYLFMYLFIYVFLSRLMANRNTIQTWNLVHILP